jgi:hypothetical protein
MPNRLLMALKAICPPIDHSVFPSGASGITSKTSQKTRYVGLTKRFYAMSVIAYIVS